jgi:hypothetical protein
MIIIDQVVVTDEVIQEHFLCNLDACKGACCVEGDAGAPLEEQEIAILTDQYEQIRPFLTPEGQKAIAEQGVYVREGFGSGGYETPLVNGGICAYAVFEPNGVVSCGIEKSYLAKATNFQKPISCHLYPIRIRRTEGYERLEYERWHICAPACVKGDAEQLPIYRFVEGALKRKYGVEFVDLLNKLVTNPDDLSE